MKDYSDQLKSPKWQKKRLEIMRRDKFKCSICNDSDRQLHIHHKKYINGNPWDSDSNDLLCLCDQCHLVCHDLIPSGYIKSIDKVRISKLPSLDDSGRTVLIVATEDNLHWVGINSKSEIEYKLRFSERVITTLNKMHKVQKSLRIKKQT